jgi:hypothetical protein
LSNVELEDTLEKNPGIRDSVSFLLPFKKGAVFSVSILSGLHYLCKQKDSFLADEFCLKILQGTSLKGSDPVYRLRQRLILNLTSKAKLPDTVVLALVIKTWNALRQHRLIKTLKWSKDEKFPSIL